MTYETKTSDMRKNNKKPKRPKTVAVRTGEHAIKGCDQVSDGSVVQQTLKLGPEQITASSVPVGAVPRRCGGCQAAIERALRDGCTAFDAVGWPRGGGVAARRTDVMYP